MGALGQHIRCRLRNDGPIAVSVEGRRLVARTVLALAESFDLLCFGAVDTHIHIAKAGGASGEELARRVEIALTLRLRSDVGFERTRVKPVSDPWHLYRLFDYVLRQDRHHNVQRDPLCEATNLPDLLGLRITGSYAVANVRRFLPRIDRGRLLALLGVEDLQPADGPLDELAEAAAAAVCEHALVGHSRKVQAAQRAAVAIAGARLGTQAMAALLGVSRATVVRLRERPVERALETAIRLQLGLRRMRWAQAVGVAGAAGGQGNTDWSSDARFATPTLQIARR